MRTAVIFSLFLMGVGNALTWDSYSSNVEVIVDGSHASTYYHHGTTYIEAIRGKKIFNPYFQSAWGSRCGGIIGGRAQHH